MRKTLSLLAMFMLVSVLAFAQIRQITGRVTDEAGQPVSGASVIVKGSSIGASADADGNFKINARTGDVLVITAVGAPSKEVAVSSGSNLRVSLARQSQSLSEVVVTTALGIKRRSDLLSSSQQGLKGSDLTSTRITDVNTALAGKISNVQVRTQSSAKLGSQSQIRIRGANSVSNIGNDPLYIVDGTPLDDINFINMDDVEDLQVLKGPGATALYGQRAANGVILITTKKARPNTSNVSFTSTYSFDKIGRLPSYQNEYSGGTAGAGWQTYNWKAGDPVEWKSLDGKRYHTYGDDASWGPKMDGSEYIPWYSWFPGSPYSFKTASLVPQPNNVRDFYSTGKSLINNISLSKGGSDYSVRVSYTNQNQSGLIPNSNLNRNFLSTQLSYDLSSHLSVSADVNYVNQKINGEFSDTYGNNASGSFNSWFHRDLEMDKLRELKNLRTPTGAIPGWNLDDLTPGRPDGKVFNAGTAYWTNPFTYYDLISAVNIQDRVYGSAGLTYKINSHFRLAGTVRHNQRNTHYESKLPAIFENSTQDLQSALAINANAGTRPASATYRTYDVRQIERNYEFLGSYNQKFGNFSVDANVGGNIRQNDYSSLDNGTKGGLVVPDLFALSNSRVTPFYFSTLRTKKIVRSVYGSANLNWNDIIVLNATLRNDWSSALPVNNNSYLYPSLGGSFIFTKFLNPVVPFISFGKLRASWAEAGSDLDPYQLALLYNVGTTQYNGNITMTTPDKAIDSSIRPQLTKSFETGLDLRFLKNRIGISATYYAENITNSIVSVTTSAASGFSSKLINAGRLNRSGVEITVDAFPIRNTNLSWNIAVNLAKNKSKVVELYPGLQNYYLGGSDYSSASGAAGYAPGVWSVVGGDWGQIRGRGIKKSEDGRNVLNPTTGMYAFVDNVNFGSVLPDFTGGVVNSLSYKNFNLNFAIDFVKGGKYFSLSDFWGGFSGLYDYTAGLNDKGKPKRDAVADGGGVHVTGVSSADLKTPVDMYVDVIDYYDVNGANKINEGHIFDLSYVKLREVNFGYTIPVRSLGIIGNAVKSLQLSLFARNPWLIYTKNKNFDPSELTGNYGESGQLPPSKTYGLTLKAGF
jgi:TonB-linked SusC/RagA family outer membrane protein